MAYPNQGSSKRRSSLSTEPNPVPMNRIHQLLECGQSCWLDNLTREMLDTGELERLVRDEGVRGVTSNPKTFADSLMKGTIYHDDIRRLANEGVVPITIHRKLMVADVRRACDVLRPVFDKSGGADGFVSIEVDPRLAREAGTTLETARVLWTEVDRPNCMVKIPGTAECLTTIEAALCEGIPVNITLLFSPERYAKVLSAYQMALMSREARKVPLSAVVSVASFFLSRIDTMVDGMLDRHEDGKAAALRGQVALALARRVYEMFRASLAEPGWAALEEKGGRPQRPLWASTGRKNPGYSETMYVDSLVARDTVNTMPAGTMEAFRDRGDVEEDAIFRRARDPEDVLGELDLLGIDIEEVAVRLEDEGIRKFVEPQDETLEEIDRIIAEEVRTSPALR